MNLPNKITIIRILMIPLFVVLFYIPALKEIEFELFGITFYLSYLLGTIVFSVAAFTDFLDGNIARKRNMVTTFGKFMDPLADKLLVASALLIAIELDLLPAFVAILIISREFMVTGIRLLAIGEGKVIAASNMGKAKTVTQIAMIIAILLLNRGTLLSYPDGLTFQGIVVDALVIAATILTVVSGAEYFMKNKNIILATK